MLGLIGLIIVALVTLVDVVGRWLFSAPIDGLSEINRLTVAVITATFFPSALVERHHISIRFLGGWLGATANHVLETFAALVTFAFFTLMGWQFVVYTDELVAGGQTTWTLGWSVGPWWGATTAFLLLCIPIQLLVLVRQLRARPTARTRDAIRADSLEDPS